MEERKDCFILLMIPLSPLISYHGRPLVVGVTILVLVCGRGLSVTFKGLAEVGCSGEGAVELRDLRREGA